ncbi:C-C motif chemokine 20-like [Pelmatolapia mariae]|uniref:C-C motif chemokine 20-like n=1 Tax=Pelmatolapia mariae TaxID=158779 RepID=UPI002FE64C4C
MASRVAALLLLGVLCFSFASGEIAVDCCLQAIDKRLPSKNIVDYIIQEAGKGCEISATVFITNHGRTLCVIHPSQKPWVRNLINIVNKKKQAQQ